MIEITWNGIKLDCEVTRYEADESTGVDEDFEVYAFPSDSSDDLLLHLKEDSARQVREQAIAAAKEDAGEASVQRRLGAIESREHALAERQMRRIGV